MAAGVVSGAAALLIERPAGVTARALQVALQVSSTSTSSAGLLDAGAGSLNIPGALSLILATKSPITIGGELVRPQMIATLFVANTGQQSLIAGVHPMDSRGGALTHARHAREKSLVWAGSIVWTNQQTDSIVWTNSIVWTSPASIVWTNTDSIVWTNSSGDSIVWTAGVDSIVWSHSSSDSIVWTGAAPDSIVWTGATSDSIVWTGSEDSIVWTAGEDVISASSDSIVWTVFDHAL
jgi:hypothetical protein